jgi:hypothetical protein
MQYTFAYEHSTLAFVGADLIPGPGTGARHVPPFRTDGDGAWVARRFSFIAITGRSW